MLTIAAKVQTLSHPAILGSLKSYYGNHHLSYSRILDGRGRTIHVYNSPKILLFSKVKEFLIVSDIVLFLIHLTC